MMGTKLFLLAMTSFLVVALTVSAAWANPWNGKVILQAFWWDCKNEQYQTNPDGTGGWYTYLAKLAPRLRDMGFDGIWVPPPCKAASGSGGMGYDLFDHYDLGQKSQKNTTGTRFGNLDEFLRLVAVAHAAGLEIYPDIVLNHMIGGEFDPTAPDLLKDPEHPGWGKVSRDKKFHYAGFGVDGRWPKGPLDFHPNPDHAYNNNDDWIREMFGPDICYRGRCSNSGQEDGNGYMRTKAREWFVWFRKQTDVDGFRFDAVKHFPPEVVEDLLYNAMDAGKPEGQQRQYFAAGEYVVGKDEKAKLDHWVDETRGRCGTFDFALRDALLQMMNARGFFDMGCLPNYQQDSRVKTYPFVNNHDTFRGYFANSSGNGKNDHSSDLKNGDELFSTIDPDDDWTKVAYGMAMAVDGSPVVYYEDLFVNYGTDRNNAVSATYAVRNYVANLVWCHQKLNFKDGAYKVPFQSSKDLLVIERSGHAVIGLNDNGVSAQTALVSTDFAPGATLHDYSGNASQDLTVDSQKQVTVTVPPKSYCVWGPPGVGGGFLGHPRRTTQEFQMDDDLGDSHPISLGYGGRLVADRYRTGGSVWVAANSTVKVRVYSDVSQKIDLRVLCPKDDGSKASDQGQHDAGGTAAPHAPLTLEFTAPREGYYQLTAKLTEDGDLSRRTYLIVEYEAPPWSTKF
jgi:alpha-amylase